MGKTLEESVVDIIHPKDRTDPTWAMVYSCREEEEAAWVARDIQKQTGRETQTVGRGEDWQVWVNAVGLSHKRHEWKADNSYNIPNLNENFDGDYDLCRNSYGSWIDTKTWEVMKVTQFGHAEFVEQFAEKNHLQIPDYPQFHSEPGDLEKNFKHNEKMYFYAMHELHWVRFISGLYNSAELAGTLKDLQKFVRHFARLLAKSYDTIHIFSTDKLPIPGSGREFGTVITANINNSAFHLNHFMSGDLEESAMIPVMRMHSNYDHISYLENLCKMWKKMVMAWVGKKKINYDQEVKLEEIISEIGEDIEENRVKEADKKVDLLMGTVEEFGLLEPVIKNVEESDVHALNSGNSWEMVRKYKGSDGGVYADYILGDRKNGFATIELDKKNGYRVRNIFVDNPLQRKGYATDYYNLMNRESLKKTGHPLRSSEIGYEKKTSVTSMSKNAQAMWNKFVMDDKAIRSGDHYEYKNTT